MFPRLLSQIASRQHPCTHFVYDDSFHTEMTRRPVNRSSTGKTRRLSLTLGFFYRLFMAAAALFVSFSGASNERGAAA